jgi:AcrR family transcriptional regulator
MGHNDGHAGGLRVVARDAARQRLSDVAIDLFAERGFEAVTIEQIAERAGISARSVHRYFAAKEDMVIGLFEANGEFVRDALLDRPVDESVLTSLHAAYAALIERGPQRARDKLAMRLLSSTPSLRARNVEKHLVWADLLTPIVAERLDGADVLLRARVLVQASLSAFQLALMAWADDLHERPISELLRITFCDLRKLAGDGPESARDMS